MNFTFVKDSGSIFITAQIWGYRGPTPVTLALDTGAESTVIHSLCAQYLGLSIPRSAPKVALLTGSGIEIASKIKTPKIKALGVTRTDFDLTCYALPRDLKCDGLLGLDFFRGMNLNINFRTGRIQLK